MSKTLNFSKEEIKQGLIIDCLRMGGTENMALDLMLLDKAINQSTFFIAVRFYTWTGDWISIGRNQKNIPPKWLELASQKKISLVRRPSGGNAVLHSNGLTYSLIWKNPPKNRKESYIRTNEWLINAFSKLGIRLKFGNQSNSPEENNCFSTSTIADLVDEQNIKAVGSAQFWKKGHLLQHGEILLEPNESLWSDIFNTPAPKVKDINHNELKKFLKDSLVSNWPKSIWKDYILQKTEIEQIGIDSINYNFN